MPRTIAEQTVEQLGGGSSVLARQRRDHVEMDRLMNRYQALDDGEDRERVLKDTVQLVFSHAFAEETVLWPAVRRSVADGEARKVRRAFALIRQDIRDEEDLLLPRLQDTMGPAHLSRLGTAWETVRKSAPTHPHPVIPRRPPGNAVLGVPLSAYDRMRDTLGLGGSATAPRKLLAGLAGLLLFAAAAVAVLRRRQ
jgi:hypothetical protein